LNIANKKITTNFTFKIALAALLLILLLKILARQKENIVVE
jgi:hypothetical protein